MRMHGDVAAHGEPASVHLWIHSIAASLPHRDALLAVITPDERARMSQFHHDVDAMRFLVGRATLRHEVGAWLGIAPRLVPLTFGPQGKPLIARGPHVNVTHSGDLVGVAVCAAAAVGIDIESTEPGHDQRDGLDSFFSTAEIRAHLALAESVRAASFFHIWTTKEALLKAAATGLSMSLQSFDVAVDPAQAPALIAARCEELDGPLCLARLAVPAGYAAAVAVFAPSCDLVYRVPVGVARA